MIYQAERLVDTLPDSTVRLIDSVLRMPVSFSERERMDMALLQAEALFGCRDGARTVSNDTNSDTLRDGACTVSTISPIMDDDFFDNHGNISTSPELERAAAYYAKKKQYDKAAYAALYSGFVQQHYGEKEAAMRSFKEAEQYGTFGSDSFVVAQARYKMGKMLYDDYMGEEAVSLLNSADYGFGNHLVERALVQNLIAVYYLVLGDYDNAEHHLQQSLMHAEDGHNDKVKRKVLNNYAVLYRQQEKYEQAVGCLKQTVEVAYLDDTELFIYYLNMGKTFMAEGSIDSAKLYYQYIERALPTANLRNETKISAYGALSRFAENQCDKANALVWHKKHEKILFDVMRQRQEQVVYGILKRYNYESIQNMMNQKLARTQRIIAFGVVLLLCIVAFFLYRSAQRNKKEAETNANLFHFMQQNKALVESNMVHEKKIHDTTQQLSDLLYSRLKAMQMLDYCMKTPKDKIALKDLEKEVFGEGDHWEAVKDVLVTLYPGLWETLKLKYPKMDEMELRVCMLSRLKLSRLAEATLLGISTSVLDKLRTKVRKTMEQDKTQ